MSNGSADKNHLQHWRVEFRNILRYLGGSVFFTYVLAWLIVVLIIGTVTQQHLGLFAAQQKYFFSWFFTVYGIPLPAGMAAMALITLGLIIKMFYLQKWKTTKIGTITAHLASLGLLLGGLLIAQISTHGNMIIPEGTRSNIISNPYTTELALIDPNGQTIATIPEAKLTQNIPHQLTPTITLKPESFYPNAAISKREEPLSDGLTQNMLRFINLTKAPTHPNEEENFAATIFTLTHNNQPQRLGLFENQPIPQTLNINGQKHTLTLRRAQTQVPFNIELIDFTKETYPGTNMARGYSSNVILHANGQQFPALIKMNEPLRYKGWTLYQASFVEGATDANGRQSTILAVVKNQGRLLPYITSLILSLGLLIHLALRLPKLWQKENPA